MKKLLIILLMCVIGLGAKGQVSQEAFRQWHGDKYSMFIHFGLYSQLGGVWQGKQVKNGYSEQIQALPQFPRKTTKKLPASLIRHSLMLTPLLYWQKRRECIPLS